MQTMNQAFIISEKTTMNHLHEIKFPSTKNRPCLHRHIKKNDVI